jgi:integrase
MCPDDLISEAEDDITSGKLPRQRRIKRHLIGFRKHLEDSGLAPLSVGRYMSAVCSFYSAFDIECPRLPKGNASNKVLKEHTVVPTHSDLADVLETCTLREKALVLSGLSSGMGAAELTALTYRAFKEGYDPETGITTLDLRREKVGYDFVTFLSPEASEAVHAYLDFRNRPPNSNVRHVLDKFEKQKVTEDSYLFICDRVPHEYLTSHSEELRRIETCTIIKIYRRISNKAGKDTPLGEWNVVRSHNMRKIFNSRLKNAGCNSDMVEYFMGHTLGSTKGAYYRPDIEKLKEMYIRFVPHLLVSPEFELVESLRVSESDNERLAKENKELKIREAKNEARIEAIELYIDSLKESKG